MWFPHVQSPQVNILVVSHSHFLKEALKDAEGVGNGKVNNVSVWRENAGQLRAGKFIPLCDLLHGQNTRRVECIHQGEVTQPSDCYDKEAYKRCLTADLITERLSSVKS